ncbi:Uncharacterised protein [Moraxella bovis]|uniref:Uncharacterized protein n=1 Tax=Moraxella bovis TaxID=476 RepID=A0A378PQD7_MORBO|nr:Uncharacterised protein [Moraxella bovis]
MPKNNPNTTPPIIRPTYSPSHTNSTEPTAVDANAPTLLLGVVLSSGVVSGVVLLGFCNLSNPLPHYHRLTMYKLIAPCGICRFG